MSKLLLAFFILSLCSTSSFAQSSEKDFIRLVDPLDSPFYYCFDLSGFGDQLRLENPVQTHTCKPADEATDQYAFRFEGEQIKVVGHDRCLQVVGSGSKTLPHSSVLARQCSNSALQKLSLQEDGTIRLADTSFCLTIGAVPASARGEGHKWRTLTVVECADAEKELSTWQFGHTVD